MSRNYYIKLLIYSVILIAAYLLIQGFLPAEFNYPYSLAVILFFAALTSLVHRGLMNADKKGPKHFVRFYIGSTGARMFLCLMIMLVYGLLLPEKATAFILTFFVVYLFYQVFEVVFLYRQLRSGIQG